MTISEAYQRLELIPLDDFICQRVEQNRNARQPIYQGIGATTWMLVSAALQLGGTNLNIISQNTSDLRKMKNILVELGYRATWATWNQHEECLRSRNHRAYHSTTRKTFFGPVFHDSAWKEKAAVKAILGPFGRIHEIRRKAASWDEVDRDHYLAFTEDGKFLFELTQGGALESIQSREDIKAVGWNPESF